MRDLLHPVLLGLLVTAIGIIAQRGGRAAAKHAARLPAGDEDTAGNATQEEGMVGQDTAAEGTVGKGAPNVGAPRENGSATHANAEDAAGKPLDE